MRTTFICDYCGKRFDDEEKCREHEVKCKIDDESIDKYVGKYLCNIDVEDSYATTKFLHPTSVKKVLGYDGHPHLMLDCLVFLFLDPYTGSEILTVDTQPYRPRALKDYTETTLNELVDKMKRVSNEVVWQLGIKDKEAKE